MADGQRYVFDQGTGRRIPAQGEPSKYLIAPTSRWPAFFSRLVARLQWDAKAIDLAPDAAAWPDLPDERRARLTTLLAGFRVAEDAVAEHLAPFGDAAENSMVMWVLYLQRRDEVRHAALFDRIAAERLEAARAHAPAGVLELFDEQLPAAAGELAAGRTGLAESIGLYHMVLEGIVLAAGEYALLEDLEDGALPGVREGVERVERDERWHIGFGLRCLIEAQPSREFLDDLLARADEAAAVWGDVVPAAVRERAVRMCTRRLSVAWHEEMRAVA
jgi:ribonucleoside-diphosphate reductase beta chain